jgi:hypothetical protein
MHQRLALEYLAPGMAVACLRQKHVHATAATRATVAALHRRHPSQLQLRLLFRHCHPRRCPRPCQHQYHRQRRHWYRLLSQRLSPLQTLTLATDWGREIATTSIPVDGAFQPITTACVCKANSEGRVSAPGIGAGAGGCSAKHGPDGCSPLAERRAIPGPSFRAL